MYNLNPHGTVRMNGVNVPVILCHADSYKLGFGSNHGDVLHWFPKYGKSMDTAREDVAMILNTTEEEEEEVTQEQFNKMGYQSRLKLKQEQPEVYAQMTGKATE